MNRFWAKTAKAQNGCIEWQGCSLKSGYGLLKIAGTRKNILAHRFAYEQAFGPIPQSAYVCHKCDNPKCVNADHLFIGTPKDNVHDMIKKGRQVTVSAPNEANPNAVLSDNEVRQIRALKGQMTQRQMAAKFNVGTSQISRILSGKFRRLEMEAA
jgi:hypothetical protein